MRMTSVLQGLRNLNAVPEDDSANAPLKADISRLERRARLMNNAIFLSVCSGIATTPLITLTFASVYLGIQHLWGAALLFMNSLLLLGAALVVFAIEVRIALTEYDHR
jgi:hypothetical protein